MQLTGKFDLPTGPNQQYKCAAKKGDRVVLAAKYGHRGGQGNTIVVLDGAKPTWSISEDSPWRGEPGELTLFAGTEFTEHSSLALWQQNVVFVTAGKRGLIGIPIDRIRKEEKEMYDSVYEVSVPHGVRNLHIGTSAQHVATTLVNEKSIALVLGTTDTDSVLSEVNWNERLNDFEVVRSHSVQGLFEQLFVEI